MSDHFPTPDIKWLDECLAEGAEIKLKFGRDEGNRYTWWENGEPVGASFDLGNGIIEPSPVTYSSVGWRSFVGIEVELEGNQYLALGMEQVFQESRVFRTAHIYLYPWQELDQVSANIGKLIEKIIPLSQDKLDSIPEHRSIIHTGSSNPETHKVVEVATLQNAKIAYERGEKLAFRTALLGGSQAQNLEDPYIAASIPAIEDELGNVIESDDEEKTCFFLIILQKIRSGK